MDNNLIRQIQLKLFLGTVALRNRTLLMPPLVYCGVSEFRMKAWLEFDSRLCKVQDTCKLYHIICDVSEN